MKQQDGREKKVVKGIKYGKVNLLKLLKGMGVKKNINNKEIKMGHRLSEFNEGVQDGKMH